MKRKKNQLIAQHFHIIHSDSMYRCRNSRRLQCLFSQTQTYETKYHITWMIHSSAYAKGQHSGISGLFRHSFVNFLNIFFELHNPRCFWHSTTFFSRHLCHWLLLLGHQMCVDQVTDPSFDPLLGGNNNTLPFPHTTRTLPLTNEHLLLGYGPLSCPDWAHYAVTAAMLSILTRTSFVRFQIKIIQIFSLVSDFDFTQ